MISIFFPPVPPLDTSFLEQVTYFLQFVLSIFIYNIALQNTDFGVLQRERGGGGGGREVVLWINNGTLLFLRKNNLSLLFLRNINWGSYEKIIRFYFLYEILKE